MSHGTEIVREEQITDECIAVTIRCCGDSKTDATRTIYGVHLKSQDDIAAEIDQHHDSVAQKHAGMLAGRDHLKNLTNRVKQH